MLKNLLAVGAVLSLTATGAAAQQRAAARACAADIKTLCADVQPGDGRVRACVKDHFNELSGPCQAVLTRAAAIGKTCAADVKQNCAGVKPGRGRLVACVKEHIADLGEPCKDALAQAAGTK
jgi:hypothetical protein